MLLEKGTFWLPKIGAALLVFLAFLIFAKIIKIMIANRLAKRLKYENIASLIARTCSITLIILGIITALGTLGINISALVASLGLTGFALGFALKDTISNIISGILIMLYRPFKLEDSIKFAGYEGVVSSIDLRYTTLNSEGNKILIPNSKLFTDPIVVQLSTKNLEQQSHN